MNVKKNLNLSFLLSIMIILSLIESVIPFVNGAIPGVKLGLANIIVLFVLYKYSFKDAFMLSILRVLLMGILRTGLFSVTFLLSFTGAFISVIMMYLFKKTNLFSIVGVSVIGALFHTIGQILMASFIIQTSAVLSYIPYIILFSIPTGIIIGIVSKELVKYFQE